MRHRKHSSKLNRTSEHRRALLRNLSISLIEHERIRTTQVKAAQIRPFLEPLITLTKNDTLNTRRLAVSRLNDRSAVIKLFEAIGPRIKDRDGGYLRIVKDGKRYGDGAPMAYIEFVDAAPVSEDDGASTATMEQKLKRKRHEMRKARAKASR